MSRAASVPNGRLTSTVPLGSGDLFELRGPQKQAGNHRAGRHRGADRSPGRRGGSVLPWIRLWTGLYSDATASAEISRVLGC